MRVMVLALAVLVGWPPNDVWAARGKAKIVRTALIAKAEKLAKACWNEGGEREQFAKGKYAYVLSVRPVEAAGLDQVLGSLCAFLVEIYNPISRVAGRALKPYAIVLNSSGKAVGYYEDDAAVVAFLADLKLKISDARAAKTVAVAFGALRGYTLQGQPVTGLKLIYRGKGLTDRDWSFSERGYS